jgi:hypothetical protein
VYYLDLPKLFRIQFMNASIQPARVVKVPSPEEKKNVSKKVSKKSTK